MRVGTRAQENGSPLEDWPPQGNREADIVWTCRNQGKRNDNSKSEVTTGDPVETRGAVLTAKAPRLGREMGWWRRRKLRRGSLGEKTGGIIG